MKLIALACLTALPVLAQFTTETRMRFCSYTNETGEVFDYRMSAPQFPSPGKLYPLIIFLHGSGECGTDNKKQIKFGLPYLMKSLIMLNQQVVILAPQCQRGNGWVQKLAMQAEYSAAKRPTASMEVMMDLCHYVIRSLPVDKNRIYITGLSLGGFGTWDAIQRYPDFFAAAVPVCGGGDLKKVKKLKRLPIWIFHGDKDKNVSVECSRRMVETMRKAGCRKAHYTEYPGVGHNCWNKVYGDQEMITWLLSQRINKKKPFWKFW